MTGTGSGNAVDFFIDRHVRLGRAALTAFTDPARSLSYGDLAEATRRFAAALGRAGIRRERRLALLLPDTIDFPIAFWGALRAGVVAVPVNTLLSHEQIGYILSDSRAEGLVISAPLLPALRPTLAALPGLGVVVAAGVDGEAAKVTGAEQDFAEFVAAGAGDDPTVAASADEVAFWLYSSGSTGPPKGARHVHGSLGVTAETYGAQVLGITSDDVVFSAAKLFFAYGLGNAMTFPLSVGARAVLLPGRPTADAVLGMMRRFAPSIFCGVPTLYAALLAHPELGPGAGSWRLRRSISAGEALPEAIGARWRAVVGSDILDGIGTTEMLHIFISNRPERLRYGTSGLAVPGYEVRIVDEAGQDVRDGALGELWVKGASAAEGYWNQRTKSRRTFVGEWTRTGDTYARDPDGMYRYCGRSDDMMKVGGLWVSPFEVEAALVAHPAVREAAVVARTDADGLVKPRAFVVLNEGEAQPGLAEALKQHVKAAVGPWKYPRWIEIVPALPKTASGKIQRYRLRAEA